MCRARSITCESPSPTAAISAASTAPPGWSWQKLPAPEILRYEELLRLAGVAAGVGIRKLRVTGGEPLVRRGVLEFIRNLHQVPGIEEVCLTTNGVRLAELAPDLLATGLRHLNLSLDTLRRDRYRELTGADHFSDVMAGLERAAALGFAPIKINCVVLKDLNDDELLDFARLTQDHPFQVRFIEFMPTVDEARWRRHFLPMAEIRRRLAGLGPLERGHRPGHRRPGPDFQGPRVPGGVGLHQLRQRPPLPHLQPPAPHRGRLAAAVSLCRAGAGYQGAAAPGRLRRSPGPALPGSHPLERLRFPRPHPGLSLAAPVHGQHRRLTPAGWLHRNS